MPSKINVHFNKISFVETPSYNTKIQFIFYCHILTFSRLLFVVVLFQTRESTRDKTLYQITVKNFVSVVNTLRVFRTFPLSEGGLLFFY